MQRIFHFSIFLIFIIAFASCGKLETKKFVLRQNARIDEESLNELRNQSGVYELSFDSINRILSFQFYPKEFDEENMLNLLKDNEWIGDDKLAMLEPFKETQVELEELVLDTLIYELTDSLHLEDILESNEIENIELTDSTSNTSN